MIALVASAAQQPASFPSPNLPTIIAAGSVTPGKYENRLLGLTLDISQSTYAVPEAARAQQHAAIISIGGGSATSHDKYSLDVRLDELIGHQQFHSPAEYVRSAREQFEARGFSILREEFPIDISGIEFTGMAMKGKNTSAEEVYRGIYSTFRLGYVLTLDVEAATETGLNEIVTSRVHFGQTSPNSRPSYISTTPGSPPVYQGIPSVAGITAPRLKHKVDPKFPDVPRDSAHQGAVVISAIVGKDGKVHNPRVVRSLGPEYDEKALEAVKQWEFEPAIKDEGPVAVSINIEVEFRFAK